MATTAQRLHVAAVIHELYAYRAHLLYPDNDVRTSFDSFCWGLTETETFARLKAGEYVQDDCSQKMAWTWRCAGLWHWRDPGYTGTDLVRLPVHYTNAREAGVGAGVIFGPGTGHHGALVLEPDPAGGNPLCGSHGRAGYDLVRLHDLATEQADMGFPGVRFLSIAHL
jgi:hypothetical protein